MWETYPFLAALSVTVAIVDAICYCVMYSAGFEIPLLVEEYRRGIMLQTARLDSPSECMEVRKIVRSSSKVTVVVGQFRELERSSTVEMGDFIISHVVSLLVAFPTPVVF